MLTKFFLVWLVGSLLILAAIPFYIAYKKQVNKDYDGDFLAILFLFWPAIIITAILRLIGVRIWKLINLLVAHILKIYEQKTHPPKVIHEVKMLSGAELDSLLTKEYEEKMGWNNKN